MKLSTLINIFFLLNLFKSFIIFEYVDNVFKYLHIFVLSPKNNNNNNYKKDGCLKICTSKVDNVRNETVKINKERVINDHFDSAKQQVTICLFFTLPYDLWSSKVSHIYRMMMIFYQFFKSFQVSFG